jgi:hypothetical protein
VLSGQLSASIKLSAVQHKLAPASTVLVLSKLVLPLHLQACASPTTVKPSNTIYCKHIKNYYNIPGAVVRALVLSVGPSSALHDDVAASLSSCSASTSLLVMYVSSGS